PIRKFQEERAIDRQAGAAHLLRCRVEVGQQTIALLDVPPAKSQVLGRAVFPWFLRVRPGCRVVTVDRLEGCYLEPSREQLRLRRSGKSTDIRASHRETAQSEV